jgi:2-aminoadipate transaminase
MSQLTVPEPAPSVPRDPLVATVRAAAERVGSSTVRDLLRLVGRPEVISLAGGLPDPASIPVAALAEATQRVLADGPAALQYAPTEGDPALRSWILTTRAAGPDDDVVVTHGSQQALDLIVRAAVRPGDPVVVADPAYVGALQVLRLAGADVIGIPADEDGLEVGVLADRLAAGLRPRLVYTVSTFHNPTGATLGDDGRAALAALADRYGFLIVEDDPYGDLRWAGTAPSPLAQLTERVVTLGSFSKIISPGLRVGYAVGRADLIADLTILKQAADLQTATFNQAVVREVVGVGGWLDRHVAGLRATYRERSTALASALTAHLGERARWATPEGGMFLWVTLMADRADAVDTADLLPTATGRGVAYVPGAAFAVDRDLRSSMRLSFATASPDELADGASRLALALDEATARTPAVSR